MGEREVLEGNYGLWVGGLAFVLGSLVIIVAMSKSVGLVGVLLFPGAWPFLAGIACGIYLMWRFRYR